MKILENLAEVSQVRIYWGMGWMKLVIFPQSATSDQSNPLKSLPKAET